MTKRISNTSHVDPKFKAIMWRINLAFVLNQSFTTHDLCNFDSFVPSATSLSIYQTEKIDHSLNQEGNKIDYQAFSLNSSIIGVCLHNVNENLTINDIITSIVGNLPVWYVLLLIHSIYHISFDFCFSLGHPWSTCWSVFSHVARVCDVWCESYPLLPIIHCFAK